MDVDDGTDIAESDWDVDCVPTILIFKDGEMQEFHVEGELVTHNEGTTSVDEMREIFRELKVALKE